MIVRPYSGAVDPEFLPGAGHCLARTCQLVRILTLKLARIAAPLVRILLHLAVCPFQFLLGLGISYNLMILYVSQYGGYDTYHDTHTF